jgi:DNA-binding response OmpR family regulator
MAKVVVVEDEADIATLVATKFRNAGHDVAFARDGEEGLMLITSNRPDVVLLDVMMPKLDGYTVCREIRKCYGASAPPIVVLLSARSQTTDRQRGIEAGCDDFVTKPFRPADLLDRVSQLIQQRGTAPA